MNWIGNNLDIIWGHTLAHLALAWPPIALSFLVAVPVAWLAVRVRVLRAFLVSGSALLYAIPSLPLFIIVPLLIGINVRDPLNVIIALTLYGLALMIPSAVDGLVTVDRRVVEAATAMGYGPTRRFFTVELPLAGPTMLAGLRVVSVSTIALVTVAAVLGVPNLGMLFTDGFQRGILAAVLAGLVCTVVLALIFDAVLAVLGRLILPWSQS